jgi:hypothetical protein
MTMTYEAAIEAAQEILVETIRDPQNEGHPEYTRGVVNLIAEMFGVYEMDTSTRMDEVARDIGLPAVYG